MQISSENPLGKETKKREKLCFLNGKVETLEVH